MNFNELWKNYKEVVESCVNSEGDVDLGFDKANLSDEWISLFDWCELYNRSARLEDKVGNLWYRLGGEA